MSHGPYGNFTTGNSVRLFRSADDGLSWNQTVTFPIQWQGFDREFLVVDNTGGKYDGTLFMNAVTYIRELGQTERQSGVGLWVSRDEGRTFNAPLVGTVSRDRFVHPGANSVMLSDGSVVFLFGELNKQLASGERVAGARVWNAPGQPVGRWRVVTSQSGAESLELLAAMDWYMPSSVRVGAQMPSLAVDPGSAAFKDRLYVAWPDERSGRSEILLTWSADRGRTWSLPFFVNDDHAKPGAGGVAADHFLPVVAVTRDGVVGVMWYDRRDIQDGLGWDVRFAASMDGGDTFLPSVRVSTATSRFRKELRLGTFGFVDDRSDLRQGHDLQVTIQGRQFFAGDTAGMAADAAGIFHPMWIDHRIGTPQLWTASVNVEGKAVRNGSPSLARLEDVSTLIAIEVRSTAYDESTREVAVTVALKNTSTKPVPLPLTVRLIRAVSEVAPGVEALNADNGLIGPDAQWTFTDSTPSGQLEPQMTSAPRSLRFRLGGDPSYRTETGFRYGLVRMQARILASR